jgi:hypothetical protein
VTEGGFNGHQRMRAGSGNSSTGAYYSFGANSTTERALGDVGANTLSANGDNMYYALRLTNGTTDTLTDFTISFNGEQWRQGASTTSDPISFAYSTDATASTFFDNTGAQRHVHPGTDIDFQRAAVGGIYGRPSPRRQRRRQSPSPQRHGDRHHLGPGNGSVAAVGLASGSGYGPRYVYRRC